MSGIATAIVGGALVTGVLGSKAATSAAETQAAAGTQASADSLAATRESNALQKEMWQANVARQQPWVTQGTSAAGRLSELMGTGGSTSAQGYGSLAKGFGTGDLALDPSYQFRLQQGQQALQASAAARGGLLTGQGAKDITNYGQQAASQEYQSAFDRYNTTQGNLYNRLAGISTLGQNAAAGVGAQGTTTAGNIASNTMAGQAAASGYQTGAAASQAAGQVGSANAWSGALSSGIGNYMMNQYLQPAAPAMSSLGQLGGGFSTPSYSIY